MTCVSQKVTAFTHDVISLTTGEELKCGDRLNIFSTLRKEFGKWIVYLDQSGEKCECNILNYSTAVHHQVSKIEVCVFQSIRRLR